MKVIEILKEAAEEVCGAQCQSVGKTGEEWKHSDLCKGMQTLLDRLSGFGEAGTEVRQLMQFARLVDENTGMRLEKADMERELENAMRIERKLVDSLLLTVNIIKRSDGNVVNLDDEARQLLDDVVGHLNSIRTTKESGE